MAGPEAGALSARARALAVLRIRSTALAVALLPAAVAVVLLVGGATGRLGGSHGESWTALRWAVVGGAVVVLLLAAAVAAVVVRARPALSPTVPIAEETAPDLYRLVRDLADRLEVPAPSAIALTPDCDSWLEDRTHRAHGARSRGTAGGAPAGASVVGRAERRVPQAPVLVIGSPFLWWMRVAELRALLAPVVAGTGPSVHPDIAAARRFVRGLDAAVAVASRGAGGVGPAGDTGRTAPGAALVTGLGRAVRRPALAFLGWIARLLLRSCRDHAAEMERAVAAAASERAQAVDYGLRIVAQEQVGLAYAGWDRLLTRVALPAWRMGRWPSRLDAGVVAALTELSRRDRLAEGFASRLSERPACDLLEEPGLIDEATSLLAARLFHGGPSEPGPDWSPVDWGEYPEEVVDRKWRVEAARLHRVLDEQTRPGGPGPAPSVEEGPVLEPEPVAPTLARVMDRLTAAPGLAPTGELGEEVAARLSVEVAREEAVHQAATRAHGPAGARTDPGAGPGGGDPWIDGFAPLFPLQPPRTGRELLADHVTAMVCCAAIDTAGAAPGLDWLDGPALLFGGRRRADLAHPVLSLVEDGDAEPLRAWLGEMGVRPEKPVRLV
ncbi:hypothetical protein [Streptomyces sp. ME19-01-6]|uniref:hypothetical protein n=1 Tax=Streptomyces sp. ME19-01-6 TaxID=3028686 RepID=UPI0029AF13FC|nr:hypothetical protein [Streptomyces sp. ME19-01-6]MDX3231204.1 hypothetical protein [Streptomyces sp. ME19-01-6]